MVNQDLDLRQLVEAIVANDSAAVERLIAASPELATASFHRAATRLEAKEYFIEGAGRYIYAGDTALHFAAAAYRAEMVRKLIAAGADVHAQNRRKDEPLHAAAAGQPVSQRWDPVAQVATIVRLFEAGADPNATNMDGATPLHKAVRTRCAMAVRTLLKGGADPRKPNKSGSAPLLLAQLNTGRGGSGSPEAKAQQQEMIRELELALRVG